LGDNFMRDYGERCIPGYQASSMVDCITSAPFED